jgi:hypothetical protein
LDFSLKVMKREHWAGIVFGGSALLLSLLISLATGNNVLYSLGQAIVFGLVFACVGYSAALVVKKFVPEFYNMGAQGETAPVETSEKVEIVASAPLTGDFSSPVTSAEPVNEFLHTADELPETETHQKAFEPLADHVKNFDSGDLDVKSGKLGKHVLESKAMKFEPKIMAEAIRTLMSKDQ